jgi:hypothetical protein
MCPKPIIFSKLKYEYSPIIEDAETIKVKKITLARGLFQNKALDRLRATK